MDIPAFSKKKKKDIDTSNLLTISSTDSGEQVVAKQALNRLQKKQVRTIQLENYLRCNLPILTGNSKSLSIGSLFIDPTVKEYMNIYAKTLTKYVDVKLHFSDLGNTSTIPLILLTEDTNEVESINFYLKDYVEKEEQLEYLITLLYDIYYGTGGYASKLRYYIAYTKRQSKAEVPLMLSYVDSEKSLFILHRNEIRVFVGKAESTIADKVMRLRTNYLLGLTPISDIIMSNMEEGV